MSTKHRLKSHFDRAAGYTRDSSNPLFALVRPPWLFMAPIVALLLFMFVGPMLAIVVFSLQSGNTIDPNPLHWTLAHYAEIVTGMATGTGVYGQVLGNTALVSAATVLATLVVSYPAAYALARKIKRYKVVFLLLLIIPLFTSVNVRVFGWALFLVENGVLHSIFNLVGIGQYPSLLYNRYTVLFGTTYVYLPFMLFPIYLSLLTIDDVTFEAARDLGAGPLTIFRKIVFPLSMPGVVIGSLFVFVLSLGADVEAQILGGGSVFTMASNINYSFGYSQNWPLGSAQAVGLLLITIVAGVVILRSLDLREIASRGESR
ncbi:ABC transporter permease [Haloarcula salina]|uniref:ABC transporter permease n=1 Tax=Haloarcula salina TaxID=1429914 RepID=A0AA41G580_9EURY|nr:ABC transporter permease [Haloarcula salina]MBV0903734.1 ABC transporter permease [Haloarcula salina]